MSCPTKSAQKRKRQTSECEKLAKKKMASDSFNSIEEFGYKFNEEGRLVDIESGNGFNFYVSDKQSYNQEHYEKLGEVITEYVYELLQSEDVGLRKVEIPLEKGSSNLSFVKQKNKESAKGFIFVSEDFTKKEKLMVLVHGSGVVRAGQWARRLIINDCLDHGTQIPYIKKAIKDGYGVVVTNTNQDEVLIDVKGKKTYRIIKESESPEKHFSYVWKNIIEKTAASKIFIVAHSYGGYLVVNYFTRFPKILERVVAVAFTDSVHSLNYHLKADVRKWFLSNSVNWISSSEDLDTPMIHQDDEKHTTRVSAGTTKHEETSWKAMESVFRYFQNKELDWNRPDSEKKDGKSGVSTSKQKKKLAPNFTRNDKITKQSNSEKSKASLVASECLKSEDSCEQSSEDGVVSNVETTEKANEKAKSGHQKSEDVRGVNKDGQETSSKDTNKEQESKLDVKENASDKKSENSSDQDGMNEYIKGSLNDSEDSNNEKVVNVKYLGSTTTSTTVDQSKKPAPSDNNDDSREKQNTDSFEQSKTNSNTNENKQSDGLVNSSKGTTNSISETKDITKEMSNNDALNTNAEYENVEGEKNGEKPGEIPSKDKRLHSDNSAQDNTDKKSTSQEETITKKGSAPDEATHDAHSDEVVCESTLV